MLSEDTLKSLPLPLIKSRCRTRAVVNAMDSEWGHIKDGHRVLSGDNIMVLTTALISDPRNGSFQYSGGQFGPK